MLRRVPGATWGGKRKKEIISITSIIWIASDGSELVPTTDVKITLPYRIHTDVGVPFQGFESWQKTKFL